jgi:hypothetical protein
MPTSTPTTATADPNRPTGPRTGSCRLARVSGRGFTGPTVRSVGYSPVHRIGHGELEVRAPVEAAERVKVSRSVPISVRRVIGGTVKQYLATTAVSAVMAIVVLVLFRHVWTSFDLQLPF